MFGRKTTLEMAGRRCDTTQITDVNSDCLEIIFSHLDFEDLLNIVDCSKQFYDAACRTYKRKYMNMNPVFNESDRGFNMTRDMETNMKTNVLEENPGILLQRPIMLFKLLRNFGHMIRNLGIDFYALSKKASVEIENYLEKYCSESLERFALITNRSRFPFENVRKPFINVTALHIITYLTQKGDHIQYLNETNLPNVKHILIASRGDKLQESKVIHYENIESFMLLSSGRQYKFPFSFGNLKHLTIRGGLDINEPLRRFINNIEHLRTLTFMKLFSNDSRHFHKLLELPNLQSNLEELHLHLASKLAHDDFLRFLSQSKKMRKLGFYRLILDPSILNNQYSSRIPHMIHMIASNVDPSWILNVEEESGRSPASRLIHERYIFERKIDF